MSNLESTWRALGEGVNPTSVKGFDPTWEKSEKKYYRRKSFENKKTTPI